MKSNQNLLQGNIEKQLTMLAIPLFMGNIIQQLYNIADSLIIGQFLGESAFAAVGVAGTIMNLAIFVISGACTGAAILLAQFYGERNFSSMKQESYIALILGLALTLFLSGSGILFMPGILTLLQTPADLKLPIQEYLTVILGGLFTAFFYNFLASMLRAVGDTRAALLFLTISMGLNVILDILFVGYLHFGIAGAAWATVLAQLFASFCSYLYLRKKYPQLILKREDMHWEPQLAHKTIHFSSVTALQQSSIYIGKALVQGAVNTMGTAAIAAYTASGRIESIVNTIGSSGSDAISIFTAQNIGAGNKQRAKQGFHKGSVMVVSLGILLSAAMFLTSPWSVNLFLPDAGTDAITYGISYLKVVSVFYPFCFMGFAFVGFFRGNGNVRVPFVGSTFHIMVRAIFSYVLIDSMGLTGVALATGLGWFLLMFYQTRSLKPYL